MRMMRMKMKRFLFVSTLALSLAFAYDFDDYVLRVLDMADNEMLRAEFNRRIEYLLTLDPHYFNYSPLLTRSLLFDCDTTPSETKPTSVHQLRPGDIGIVAGVGDSITAALGAEARTLFGMLYEYRGRSWSMGGLESLESVVTMPNILRKFNPKLYGFSKKEEVTFVYTAGTGFNQAVSGSTSEMVPNQARKLIEEFKNNTNVDYLNEWKLITFFIGGNDLCNSCHDKNLYSPENFVSHLRDVLDIFHAELPKTLINLALVLDITNLKDVNGGIICSFLHQAKECPCGVNATQQDYLHDLIAAYQKGSIELIDSGRYDTRDDFTVVVQPLFKEFNPPRLPDGSIDQSYLAPDCFHFSPKGHALAAVSLWNNMLQPVGQKSSTFDVNVQISCPTKDRPYLFTRKNSN